ncbi:MAG: histidine kinase [Flavobacteriaceae bacterium]
MKTNKTFIDSILQNTLLLHIVFWIIYLLFSITMASLNSGKLIQELIKYLALLPSQLMASYILIYFQIPKLSLKKRYVTFFISLIITGYFFSAFARFCMVHIAEPFFREEFVQETILEIISDTSFLFSVYFPSVYTVAFILLIIRNIRKRAEEQQHIEILKKEKATNELKFLRAQVQPHFLFNTLNNLYALTLAKSDLAPEVVLKLSEMLDFILYQSNQSEIPIEKELELIQGFTELEKLRYGDSLDLRFDYKVDNMNTMIAPLILLPFVENAFKHGAKGIENPVIKIDIKAISEKLIFEIYNKKSSLITDDKENIRGGIGITNLQRQLELNYPEKYTLVVENEADFYKVQLTINLN